MTKRIAFCYIIFASLHVNAEPELCPIDHLSNTTYKSTICQYNLGTTAFRANAYELAAAHWRYLLKIEDQSDEAKELKNLALGNYSYLQFHGFGIDTDHRMAVESWKSAIKGGNYEARYHLGAAYSNQEFYDFDYVKAYAWYRSLILVSAEMENLEEDDLDILEYAKTEIAEIETKLSKRKIAKAKTLAEAYAN